MKPRLIGRYDVLDEIGSGGMATVYRARHAEKGVLVALKVMHPHLSDDASFVKRFRREAETARSLLHPNIVRVLDHGVYRGDHFLVMEYVEGATLQQLIQEQGPMTVDQSLDIAAQVTSALVAAHDHGIVHRDIKPQNLMVTPRGEVKVMDFGIAKAVDLTTVTQTGVFMGSPHYVSPEQARGAGQVDIRSDIYSVGVVLYQMLTGSVPFDGETPWAVLRQHLDAVPTPLRQLRPDISPQVQTLVEKAMAVDPEARYQTPLEMLKALEEALTDTSKTRQELATVVGRLSKVDKRRSRIRLPMPAWAFAAIITPLLLIAFIALTSVLQPSSPTSERTAATRTASLLTSTQSAELAAVAAPSQASTAATPTTAPPPPGMVLIPAGEFLMGSPGEDPDASEDERPQRLVYLDAFYIDISEVTNAWYAGCVEAGVCDPPGVSSSQTHDPYYDSFDFDDYPVVNVTWNDAQTFCEWAGKRLPNEAEWEKAARGTDGRAYPWGVQFDDGEGNCGDEMGDTAATGSCPRGASPYGVQDMAGNVAEWVEDVYQGDYYQEAPDQNPAGPSSGSRRVVRGGSWQSTATQVRAASRAAAPPDGSDSATGFRCALSASVAPSPMGTVGPRSTWTPTPTPTSTATPVPTSTPVGMLLSEDLDSDSPWSGDYEYRDDWYHEGGQLHHSSESGYGYSWLYGGSYDNYDFTMGDTAHGELGSAGVVFRRHRSDQFYFFLIDTEGQYVLIRSTPSEGWQTIAGWQLSPALRTGTSTNQLRVVCVGSSIALFANGEHLTTLQDAGSYGGSIGPVVRSYQGQTNVHWSFDNLSVWQAPSSVPAAPALGPLTLLYQDDFSGGGEPWWEGGDKVQWYYAGDQYHASISEGSWYWYRYRGNYQDFQAGIDVTAHGDKGAGGMVFRATNSDFYRFRIDPQGRYQLSKHIGDPAEWHTLVGFERSPAIRTGAATNRLKVICKSNRIALFVNDQHLTTVVDDSLTRGSIGPYVASYEGEANVHWSFDNLRVYSAPETMP
jgi:serine/threonine protein kinase